MGRRADALTMKERAIRALIFDLDDTLFDHQRAMASLLRGEFGLHAEVDALLALDARGRGARDALCDAIGTMVGSAADEVWARICASLGGHVTPVAADVFQAACLRFEVAVLTNGGSLNQRNKIASLGVDALIAPQRILISGELGVDKPDPRAFAAALSSVACDPAEAVYIGDDPSDDIAGARAAGLRTCWVARGRVFPDTSAPDWTIESIADLPQLWDRFPT